MRPIKFRVWDPNNDTMTENIGINKIHLFDFDGDNITEQEGLIIMQYTGLTDRNGIEIWEGDIVKQEYHIITGNPEDGPISFDGHHIGEVVITASKGVCMRKPFCYSEETDEMTRSNQYKSVAGYRCEVIGNIYANPELATVQDK